MSKLMCKLDWFSFTFPISLQGEKDNEFTLGAVLLCFHDFTAHRLLGVVTNALWRWEQPTGFYTSRIQCPKTGLQIQFAPGNQYALCTLSGTACDVVLKSVSFPTLANCAGERATRLDFAVDIETTKQPKEFIDEGYSHAFNTHGFIESHTGTTYYVGSRRGERMARVYRYASPHPRSHLLRVEAEYKGDAAKMACAALLERSLTEVTLSAHLPFAWESDIWDVESVEISKIPARAYDKKGAETMRWLELTVIPAIKKAAKADLINLQEFIEKLLS